ncbi:hypothetical protein KM043_001951 [Ampulex compressa]|nr:hypothetical protein KM043_001951 [Ampulex compressa]
MAQKVSQFTIENNVLIGQKDPNLPKCKHAGEMVLEALKSKPDFVGQVEAVSGKENTFSRIRERSVKCALWLKQQGLQADDIVGICTDNNLDTSVPLFAALYLTRVICTWDHDMSIKSARYYLSLISPKVVFANAAHAGNLVQAAKEEKLDVRVVVIGKKEGYLTLDEIIDGQSSAEVEAFTCTPAKNLRDVAVICCSSGTTGLPKGTQLSHESLVGSITPIEEARIAGEIVLWTPTIRWHYGLTLMIEAVTSYAKCILMPDSDDETLMFKYAEKYQVTFMTCDPCVVMKYIKFGSIDKYPMLGLRKWVISGAKFKPHIHEVIAKAMPHCHVIQCYGMTDSGGMTICQLKNGKYGACGFVCREVQIKIVDQETGVAVGANKTGELWIKSPFILNEYYKNPEATKRALDSDGWLHTGDLGYYDDDGEIFIIDRISEFINYRGVNLSPAEIESVLESHPSVLRAAVVGVPHDIEEEHPMAFILKVPGKEVSEEELMNLMAKELPWYCKLRAGIKFMDELPRTATGKVAKKELKELAKSLKAASQDK